jgi:hypothetical protein
MAELTNTALFWRRLDQAGAEHVLLDERGGTWHAHGTMLAAAPVPFSCRYDVHTDAAGATVKFEATVEGPNFVRSLRMERASARWRVTAGERGNLDAVLRRAGRAAAGLPGCEDPGRLGNALDVSLSQSPLTNTLPVRRLGLLDAKPGTSRTVEVVWVLLPSLEVVDSLQNYTVGAEGKLTYLSGSFSADITFDSTGYVTHYPGLAERA